MRPTFPTMLTSAPLSSIVTRTTTAAERETRSTRSSVRIDGWAGTGSRGEAGTGSSGETGPDVTGESGVAASRASGPVEDDQMVSAVAGKTGTKDSGTTAEELSAASTPLVIDIAAKAIIVACMTGAPSLIGVLWELAAPVDGAAAEKAAIPSIKEPRLLTCSPSFTAGIAAGRASGATLHGAASKRRL